MKGPVLLLGEDALVVTCSTPIAVEVAHVRAAIATIEFHIPTVVPNVTAVAPDVFSIGAQFCS